MCWGCLVPACFCSLVAQSLRVPTNPGWLTLLVLLWVPIPLEAFNPSPSSSVKSCQLQCLAVTHTFKKKKTSSPCVSQVISKLRTPYLCLPTSHKLSCQVYCTRPCSLLLRVCRKLFSLYHLDDSLNTAQSQLKLEKLTRFIYWDQKVRKPNRTEAVIVNLLWKLFSKAWKHTWSTSHWNYKMSIPAYNLGCVYFWLFAWHLWKWILNQLVSY